MTREELESMEGFASILSERLEEVTDKYDDIYDRLKYLEDEPVSNVHRVIDKIQEEYNELYDKLEDLSEAVEEFTKEVRRMKDEETQ